jgi:hypothetical protein
MSLGGKSSVTSSDVTVKAAVVDEIPRGDALGCEDNPGFIQAGSKSLHPFCYPVEVEESIHLGPGLVQIDKTRVYGKHQTVVIEPGTSLRMARGASIISYGKVLAEGRTDAKIEFIGGEGHWGGIALQGAGTAGSRFANVEFTGGTQPELSFFDFPGMVNVHDTHDVRMSSVLFANNEKSDDALHVAYVDGLELADAKFSNVRADALDLEYTSGHVSRLQVNSAGDDGVDLMGSHLDLVDSAFIKCKGNGLSVGEHSDVSGTRILVAHGMRAVLLKNASSLAASELLSYDNANAVRLENESLWYMGESQLKLHAAYAVKTSQTLFDGSKATTRGVLSERLQENDLRDLRALLQLDSWAALDSSLEQLRLRRER